MKTNKLFLKMSFTQKLFLVITILLIVQTDFAQVNMNDLEISKLINECRENFKTNEEIYNYTFKQTRTRRFANKKGEITKTEVVVSEAYPTRNRRYLVYIEISKNGVSNSTEKIAGARRQAVKQIEKATNGEVKAKESEKEVDKGTIRLHYEDFLKVSEFYSPRYMNFRNINALVLDFRPRSDFRPTTRMETLVFNLIGSIWIDVERKQIMRLEAYPTDKNYKTSSQPLGILRPDAAVVFEQKLISEDFWMQTIWHVDSISTPQLFNDAGLNITFEFSDFDKFETDVEDYKVTEPKNTQVQ